MCRRNDNSTATCDLHQHLASTSTSSLHALQCPAALAWKVVLESRPVEISSANSARMGPTAISPAHKRRVNKLG